MKNKKVIIAGGGTGGHIYPALAIAEALQKLDKDIEIHFVGTPRGLESKIIPRAGWPLHLIDVSPLNYAGSIFGKIKSLLKLPKSFFQSISLLFELKPLVVLGVGGYASGPFVFIASVFGFKTALWEPNAIPGMTNRWLSRVVRKCFVVFEESKKFLKSEKVEMVGLPVRSDIEKMFSQKSGSQASSASANPQDGKFKVLIFGGSQGAKAINQVLSEAVERGMDWRKDIEFRHQTGVHDFANIKQKYEGLRQVQALEYLHDMPDQYAWADLVICRSGASTVAELAASGKAALLIPYPFAADDHQLKNAQELEKEHAAELIQQKDLNADILIRKLTELKNNPEQLREYSKQIKKFYKPQSSDLMASKLQEMFGS